jgi:hydroxypyruvate isomerase
MPKLAANLTMLFNEVPFLDRFSMAAEAGFRAVEFLFPYEYPAAEIKKRLDDNALAMALFNLPVGDWAAGDRGMACDPNQVGRCRDGVGTAIEYAKALGCSQLHLMAGLRPPQVDEALLRETYIGNLKFAAAALARHGLTLLIEAINTRDMPGFYLNRSSQAFEIMRAVNAPNLLFQYDVYHMQIVEGDLAHTIEEHLPHIGHVQIADTPGRHEPGTGEINYGFLLDRLDALGYRGWVGCEYRPAAGTTDGLGWAAKYLGAGPR